ncbi:hypothetical protein VN1169_06480 [Helicobacter pylori]|nr:hypothetical protein VN1169_06480 [Helicobacter pylori]
MSKSVLVKQAFENAKEKQLKAYKQMASKDDFAFILYEPLGTEASDKQISDLTGRKDTLEAWGGLCEAHLQNRCGFWAFRKQEQSRRD